MPIKYLKELLQLIDEMGMLTGTLPDESNPESITEEQRQMKEVLDSGNALVSILDELRTKYKNSEEPFSSEEIQTINEGIQRFVDASEAFSQGCNTLDEEFNRVYADFSLKTCGKINTMKKALENSAKTLAVYSKDGSSAYSIINDVNWAMNLLNEDPNSKKDMEEPAQKWQPKDHSIKENLDQYRSDVAIVKEEITRHFANLAGDNFQPYETLEYKMNILQDIYNRVLPKGVTSNVINDVLSRAKDAQTITDPANISIMSPQKVLTNFTVMTDFFFDITWGKIIDLGQYNNEIEINMAGRYPAFEEALKKAISNFKLKPSAMGIDSTTYNHVTSIGELLAMPGFVKSQLSDEAKENPNHSLARAIQIGDRIHDHMLAYISGDVDELLPLDGQFTLYYDYLSNYVATAELFDSEGVYNQDINTCWFACSQMSKLVPGMQERIAEVTRTYNQRFEYAMDMALSTYTLNPAGSREAKTAWRILGDLKDRNPAMEARYEQAYFIRMLRDPKFKEKELLNAQAVIDEFQDVKYDVNAVDGLSDIQKERVKTYKNACKTIIFSSIADHELASFTNYLNIKKSLENNMSLETDIKLSYNNDLAACFKETMDANSVEKCKAFLGQLHENDQFKSMTSLNPKMMKALSQNPKGIAKTVFGDEAKIVRKFNKLDILTQDSGDFYKTNTDSYNKIGSELKKMTAAEHKVGGVKPEDYKPLYDACQSYFNTHDSKPFFANGKLRMKATGELLVNIALDNFTKMPENVKADMEKDMMVNMIRSKDYRDYCIDKSEKLIAKLCNDNGHKGMISFNEASKLAPEAKQQLDFAMRVFAFGTRVHEELAPMNKEAMIMGKMPEVADRDNLLEQFSAVRDYAELANNGNFERIISENKIIGNQKENINMAKLP